ncbi:serine/threonine-protein kinase [Planomonospora sp. ID82291]|uniref:serine/threonine-protein kinase n=1 Tax=Planomonospora sp. ID82291 TaxID=2738136 RepID=UPI0018C397F1|nr:serine/threonine-protein kinase [Planomonospora sp. ID82291]MBG0817580.1 serine/threonine protein kinase [Planomonospora sp. ID82291]
MAATPLTPDDPVRLGPYRLAGRLGEGGQGVVYLAHTPGGGPVAVKLLFRGDAASRARLTRELSALESVAPFCTARVLDASVDGPRPYVVSEFVDGPSLEQRVRRSGPLRGGELERLVVGTATALAAVHAAGVVHRDFKPANVLLGPDGPRVVDFGIAREDGAATHTSGLIGTPAYLSPEQIAGSPASPASDVFAWAATMVYAATGTSPFGADTVPAVLHRILSLHPDLSALPARYGALIASCLDKDPAGRPTARALMVSLVDPGAASGASTGDLARLGSELASPAGAPDASGPPGPPGPLGSPGRTDPGRSARTALAKRASRGRTAGSALVAASVLVATGVAAWLVLGGRPGDAGRSAPPTPVSTGSSPSGSAASGPPGKSPGPAGTGRTDDPRPSGPVIPASFAGRWAGDGITSTNPLSPGGTRIEVELTAGDDDAAWAEPEHDCKGRITLKTAEEDTLTFELGQGTGCVAGTVWLTRKGRSLTYTWKDVPGLGIVTQTGDLTKVS